MHTQKIYNQIEKHLKYKNPSKLILYVDICSKCEKHLLEYIEKNTVLIKLFNKAIMIHSRFYNRQELGVCIQYFADKNNVKKTLLIILNDDTLLPHESCVSSFRTVSEHIKAKKKYKIRIELQSFCLEKSPYCYIKKTNSIKNLSVNEQILYFQPTKIYYKRLPEQNEARLNEHKHFAIQALVNYYNIQSTDICIIDILENTESHNQYLKIMNTIFNEQFIIIYYEPTYLERFIKMNKIAQIEVTNKLSANEIQNLITPTIDKLDICINNSNLNI